MAKFLTIPEVAVALQVSTKTVRRLIWAGRLQVVKVGRQHRIDPDVLTAYLGRS